LSSQFLELFEKAANSSRAKEPGTPHYELRRGITSENGGVEELVVREV
jgi:quinol monooxygenase YgiN